MGSKKSKKIVIGVLAIQGDFYEHCQTLKRLGVDYKEVRTLYDLKQTDGLIIPGGESTAIGLALRNNRLKESIQKLAKSSYPIYGTCAGCILIAKEVDSPFAMKLIDITVQRNAYGRQLDSFEAVLQSEYFKPFTGVFIRAPKILSVGEGVKVLLKYHNEPVLVQENNTLAGTFHPELTQSLNVHKYFIEIVKQSLK